MARSHKAVTCLITRVCNEPTSLQPYCVSSLARQLPKTPLCRYTATTVTCRGNQKCKQHVTFGFGIVGCFFFLLAYGSDEYPSLHHCLSWEKSPKTCPPSFFSSVLHSWLNDENHGLQWKVAAEKWLSRKSFSDMDSQILGNILLQIPTEPNLWAGYSSPPSPFISFSSNGSSQGAVPEKDKVGLSH